MMMKLVAATCLTLLFDTSPAAVPVEPYGILPSIEQAVLSPDGSMIAYIQTTQEWRALAIVNVNTSQLVAMSRVGAEKVRSVDWADDQHLLITTASSSMPIELSGERVEWRVMISFDLKTKKWTGLLDHARGDTQVMNVVYGRPVIQRKGKDTLVYVHGILLRDQTEAALFRSNLTTGRESLVKQGSEASQEWMVDDSGQIVAEQAYHEKEHRWSIEILEGNHVRQTVSGVAAIDAPDMLGLSANGDSVIMALTDADASTWKPLLLKDGTWGPELAKDEMLTEILFNNGSRRMMGTAYVGDKTRYHFDDPALQAGWEWTERVFGYQRVVFESVSADHSKILLKVMGVKSGYGYFIADVKEHLTRPVGKIYAGVAQIAEVRAMHYPAADGLEIPAYLTLPSDRPPRNLAVVVMPHGGPEAHDILGFDWWAQALAAQGYAVLQPNFRGSNLSKHLLEAGYGEWGRKMQTDLSDGLGYLAAQGIVDPQRACIVGASYGGYAALAGVSLQSGIYRCAVSVAGVSDPAGFLHWIMGKESVSNRVGQRYLERFFGVTNAGDQRLDEISPVKHATQISVPVLLIHGKDDTTVPYAQSVDISRAMKRAGRDAEFVTLSKEDHYLSRSATRLQMLHSSVDFLIKNNPPD